MASKERLDYGIGAPGYPITFGVLAVVSGVAAVILGVKGFSVSSITAGVISGFGIFCATVWALGDRYGRVRARDVILSRITWHGDERVLDVGCGHGLLLVGAAKKLKTGCAVGVDIWRQADQWNNNPENAARNARIEGVADRVEIHTCDASKLIFPDESFDIVLSGCALHDMAEREQVLHEIIRVLKPGGQVAIYDIRHIPRYQKIFLESGMQQVQDWGKLRWYLPLATLLTAIKPAR